jgi:DNA gyrase subunit A
LRTMGRATQGVRLINLRNNDSIAAVCRTPKSEEEEVMGEENDSQNEGSVEGSSADPQEGTPEE